MPVAAVETFATSFADIVGILRKRAGELAHVQHRQRDVVGIVRDGLLDRLQRLVGAREDGARAGEQILHARSASP